MDDLRRVPARVPSESIPPDDVEEPAAVRSVRDAAGAVPADEAAATEARRRYKSEGIAPLSPDSRIAPILAPGEAVLSVRRCVGFDRRPASPGKASAGRGDLYVTSQRLIVVGQPGVAIDLDEIEEAMLSVGRLMLIMADGGGMSLEVDRPQLLRVEIAAARASARG